MNCHYCKSTCIKKGLRNDGCQKYQCSTCKKYQQHEYKHRAWHSGTSQQITSLIKESCGIRSISRVLGISSTTVIKIIKQIATAIQKPALKLYKEYEADELKTFVQQKKNDQWIIYAIDKKTRRVADFRVGKRNKINFKKVIDTLLYAKAKLIYTDKLNIYPTLIPKEQHKAVVHNTNYIERKNLNLRTHLKCLTRRSICFAKSIIMLMSIMKIYFWT